MIYEEFYFTFALSSSGLLLARVTKFGLEIRG